MDKIILVDLISAGLSQRKIADKLNCSQSNVKHWLKKFGLKTQVNRGVCRECGELDSLKFYKSVKGLCKACFNKDCVNRQRIMKKRVVEYMGGKCQLCGYNKYFGALECHHKDPTQKDPKIRFGASRSNWNKLRAELDKCVLYCANCHREKHADG